MNEANSYTEEVRRSVKEKYGFEKLYSQGLSIKTPLNINYQIQALESLRNGIEAYDRRTWLERTNYKYKKNSDWKKKKLKQYKLDPTLNWHFAEITNVE